MRITFTNGREPIDVDKDQLAGIDLRFADLRGSNLYGCDFSGSDLSGSNLRGNLMRWCNLQDANLRGCDLRDSDLCFCNLTNSYLTNADLRGANLDFASIPLSCYSLKAKLDKRQAVQLLYHACRWLQTVDDKECQDFLQLEAVKKLANQFHMVNECGEI